MTLLLPWMAGGCHTDCPGMGAEPLRRSLCVVLFLGVAFSLLTASGIEGSRRQCMARGGRSATAATPATFGGFSGVGETRSHGH